MAISIEFLDLVADVANRSIAAPNWSIMLRDRVKVALSNSALPTSSNVGIWFPSQLTTARPLPHVSVAAAFDRTTVNGKNIAIVTNKVIVYSASSSERTTITTNLLAALKSTYSGEIATFSVVNGTSGGKYTGTIRIAQKL